MNDIQADVRAIVRDSKRLKQLLSLEKERRGISKDAMIFVGTANLANYCWCAQQAVLKSRAEECDFFAAYLADRIVYAQRLGLLTRFPKNDEGLLQTGDEISLEDVEQLLKDETAKAGRHAKRRKAARVTWISETTMDKDGKRSTLINPDLPPEVRQDQVLAARIAGIRIRDIEEDPKRRGQIYQKLHAEKYPSIRWHFPWGQYCVGGVPDGLTADFVYEFKSTRNRYLLQFMKPVAFAQANLYGFFFQRPRIKVQIEVVEEKKIETFEQPTAATEAENILASFARTDAGDLPIPPVVWKCKKCEFRTSCPISQAK